jgi:phage terminase large subunit-like protein
MSALCLVFPPDDKRDFWAAIWRFWIPEAAIQKRSKKDGVPYDRWARDGVVTATPGNITDYDSIRRDISGTYIEAIADEQGIQKHDDKCLADKFKILEIAYDRWNATQLVTQLGGDGLTMAPLGQGFQSLSAPMKEMERLIVGKMISHGSNPAARWCASNVAVSQDPAGNIKPDKAKSTEKIDGIAAMVDAIARAMIRPAVEQSVYETRGLLTL